ncbi:MAG: prolipoprotein diacylglyceryl transferase [Christensenellaceae bacterium]|nr:prolipoprotein diacylglyceryl transferase [Christensenellaceae bacterium]
MQANIYGILIAVSIVIGLLLCIKEEKERKLPKDTAVDMALYAVPLAVIGARLYYVVFEWDSFKYNLISIIHVWEGGLAIYGGVIGGLLGLIVLSKRKEIALPTLTDMIVPSLILGQAIGRWGNYFNNEAHGGIVEQAFLRFFPVSVLIDGNWYYATFFYESVWNFLGFIFLYSNRKNMREYKGALTLWYFAWYSLGRMVIEMLRTDSLMLGNIKVSQALSLLIFIVSILILTRKCNTKKLYLLLAIGSVISIIAAIHENIVLLIIGAIILFVVGTIVYKGFKGKENGQTMAI